MTLTYPAIDAARQILWLVTGAEKREPLAKLLAGDRSIPAGRVENDEMIVVADEAAASSGLPLPTGKGCALVLDLLGQARPQSHVAVESTI